MASSSTVVLLFLVCWSAIISRELGRVGFCDKQGRNCNCFNDDIHITQEWPSGVDTFVYFHVTNTCPCDATSIVVNYEGWTQRLVNPYGVKVNVPSYGLCTLFPGVRVRPIMDKDHPRYSRTYDSYNILPMSLHSVTFDPRCNHIP